MGQTGLIANLARNELIDFFLTRNIDTRRFEKIIMPLYQRQPTFHPNDPQRTVADSRTDRKCPYIIEI